MPEAWIIDGVRSPRGRGKATGSLHGIHPQELLAQVLRALTERTGVPAGDIEDIVAGNGHQIGEHGSDIGRMAALTAGFPITVPGVSLNRFCGSGQQAVNWAAMGIMSGQQDVVVGCGVESMSRLPADVPLTLDAGNERLRARHPLVPQGISGDLIATLEGFTREDVDRYALESQARCARAVADARFDGSLVPILRPDGTLALDRDELPRPGTTMQALGELPPSFARLGADVQPGYDRSFDSMCLDVYPEVSRVDHVHHAGNSSGVADGAAAIMLASPQYATAHGLRPRARVVATAVAGAEPVIMLTAPTPAAEAVMAKAGLTSEDIDIWEVNEAFAAVPMKTMRDLKLDPARVNVNGGAIALGHPIGATGPMLIQTALDELERRDATLAAIVMCTGGGMATATVIERIS